MKTLRRLLNSSVFMGYLMGPHTLKELDLLPCYQFWYFSTAGDSYLRSVVSEPNAPIVKQQSLDFMLSKSFAK
ncbi:hypothetical protein JTE90_023648 [Oedothorax gibbosus]|uniref:Uncharacterized protein n=1 Tax=Oedothorax gibbosus TaxID=931172 RepID=A0AAV6V0G6_9ARAC|nr:hypothetical protein JTE90_023648 [Oedothorax gibbosus]